MKNIKKTMGIILSTSISFSNLYATTNDIDFKCVNSYSSTIDNLNIKYNDIDTTSFNNLILSLDKMYTIHKLEDKEDISTFDIFSKNEKSKKTNTQDVNKNEFKEFKDLNMKLLKDTSQIIKNVYINQKG